MAYLLTRCSSGSTTKPNHTVPTCPPFPRHRPNVSSPRRYKPSVVEFEKELILESPHPHAQGADEVYPLDFPGADSIQVWEQGASVMVVFWARVVYMGA